MSAFTISLLNMKGGVGKTTLAVNLAWHMCRRGHNRVLLVDLDPQFNASQYTMAFDEWTAHKKKGGTMADLFLAPGRNRMPVKKRRRASSQGKGIKKFIFERETTPRGGQLDIVPSELTLSHAVKNPQGIPYKLEKQLATVVEKYDYVFIDCAPTDSILTDAALMASDFVLTPIKPDRFSILGYAQIQETLDTFRESYPDPHEVADLGVVFTQVEGTSDIEDRCMRDVQKQAEYVFEAKIKKSKSYLRSVHNQTPVFDTRFTHQVTKQGLRDLVTEMEERISTFYEDEEE